MIIRLLEVAVVAWANTVKEVGISFATGKDPRAERRRQADEYDRPLDPDAKRVNRATRKHRRGS